MLGAQNGWEALGGALVLSHSIPLRSGPRGAAHALGVSFGADSSGCLKGTGRAWPRPLGCPQIRRHSIQSWLLCRSGVVGNPLAFVCLSFFACHTGRLKTILPVPIYLASRVTDETRCHSSDPPQSLICPYDTAHPTQDCNTNFLVSPIPMSD